MVRDVPHRPRAAEHLSPLPMHDSAPTTPSKKSQCLPLRILTHNIRYAATNLDENERPWPERRPKLLNELRYHTRFLHGDDLTKGTISNTSSHRSFAGASFICLQEVLHDQLRDILYDLNQQLLVPDDDLPDGEDWAHIGIGRDDGKEAGEYSPILYPKRLFKLLYFENTWLSPTPDRPSKGWDAGNKRILTTGVFEHKYSKQRVAIFNTHFDNEGSEARLKSVPIILDVITRVSKEWASESGSQLNFALAGDFNSRPNAEAYQAFASSGMVLDAFEAVPAELRYGDLATFSGFTPRPDDGRGLRRIDVVWYGPKASIVQEREERWKIQGYSTLTNVFDDGIYSSDHRAVVTDAILCTY